MDTHTLSVWIVGATLAFIGAPLLPGIINRVKAFFAGRKGPSAFQLYYDIAKLIRKPAVYSTTCNWIFRMTPVINCAVLVVAALLLPFGGQPSPLNFSGDIILFVYLCGTSRFFTVMAALDTGSSFEGMGASRECQFSVLAEGAIIGAFSALILLTHHLSLSGILNQMTTKYWGLDGTALLLVAFSFFIVVLTECCRVPIDDPDTHLELTMIHEAMILDNSGVDLALTHYAASLKMWLLLAVEAMLLCPTLTSNPWLELLIEAACVLVGAFIIGIIESITARFRFLKVPQFLSAAFGSSLLACVLMLLFKK